MRVIFAFLSKISEILLFLLDNYCENSESEGELLQNNANLHTNTNINANTNNNLKEQLIQNGQLKLNLSPLFNAQKPNPVNGKVEIKGFHEEFMARLDEFSQSWRMAAMAEKKF